MTAWRKVRGSQNAKPAMFDTTTSPSVVYQHKGVERIEVENEDGSTTLLWEYDERELTHEEYLAVATEKNAADIDFMAMTLDVNLGE